MWIKCDMLFNMAGFNFSGLTEKFPDSVPGISRANVKLFFIILK